jgi:Tol biopolymer transport system component
VNDRTSSPQWERVAAVFDEAMARDASERLTFVRLECAGDEALRQRVESMLDAIDRPALLDLPAGEMVADLFDRPRPQPGARLGQYQVESFLGAGGMGEVYSARDTTLGRSVAIKLLPADVGPESERVARFRREAKLLAALSHPNVAMIYGLEELDSPAGLTLGLVLELVDGETLAERLKRGRLPIEDALTLARQIADGVEAAHYRGIVHRDLKPANIKITKDGAVKVLDFGLAKLAHPDVAGAPQDATLSPTITSPAFVTGVPMLLGTAAYMSPEQAKGREADKRSDIWAFGCVLFEMLAGRRPFDGDEIAEVLGAVVRLDPAWEALPAGLPLAIRRLLEGCLAKDPSRRIADMSVAKFLLENASNLAAPAAVPATTGPRVWVWAAAGAAIAAIVTTGSWYALSPRPAAPQVTRFEIAPTGNAAVSVDPVSRDLTIMPDGRRIVYVTLGPPTGPQLLVRRLDQLDTAVLIAEGAPRAPFGSPDGAAVGFVNLGSGRDASPELRTVAVSGGPVAALCTLDGQSRGATWGDDGQIVFATSNPETGLQRVPASGGEPVVLTRPDRARGESDHLWPHALPGGKGVLFTIVSARGGADPYQIAVLDPGTSRFRVVLDGGSQAQYTRSGHLVYAAGGALHAVAFDLDRLEARGPSVLVTREVTTLENGTAQFDISQDGALIYVPVAPAQARTMVWVNRRGGEEPAGRVPPRVYQHPRLSPDGRQVAVEVREEDNDIWLWDIASDTLRRLGLSRTIDRSPVWMPDGRRIVFTSPETNGIGTGDLFARAADGSGAAERLAAPTGIRLPLLASSVTSDGRQIVAWRPGAAADLWLVTPGDQGVRQLLGDPAAIERNGEISPDGRWLAYESNATGQFEIYLRAFPGVDGGEWQVSAGGGVQPAWTRDGKELVYVGLDRTMRSVDMTRAPDQVGMPQKLFDAPYLLGTALNSRSYDVTRDGSRFLMIREARPRGVAAPATILVTQNWTEELKRQVPTD